MKLHHLSATCALLFYSAFSMQQSAADDFYQWIDNDGNLSISDRPPPPGIVYEKIDGARYEPPKSTKPDGRIAETPVVSGQRSDPTARSGQPSGSAIAGGNQPERDAQLCRQATDNVFTLETFARVRTTDENGTIFFMDDEERAEQLSAAKELIDQHCE